MPHSLAPLAATTMVAALLLTRDYGRSVSVTLFRARGAGDAEALVELGAHLPPLKGGLSLIPGGYLGRYDGLPARLRALGIQGDVQAVLLDGSTPAEADAVVRSFSAHVARTHGDVAYGAGELLASHLSLRFQPEGTQAAVRRAVPVFHPTAVPLEVGPRHVRVPVAS
jgi:hypothetical protein